MLTYIYEARDPRNGQKIKAEVQADSQQSAAKLIKEQGFTPIDIVEKHAADQSLISRYKNRIKTKDKVLFSRQLSTLINAGMPLIQSLRSVARQTRSKNLQSVINSVIVNVEAGSSFSEALSKHPDVFNRVYVSLIASGETSGTLDKALERIAAQQEKDAEVISKVRGAMVYPIIVLIVMGFVAGFMVLKVLPQVELIYNGLPGATLPWFTRALLAVSHFLIRRWYVVAVLVLTAAVFTTRYARTIAGRRFIDKMKMKAWPIGTLFMKVYMARFARTSTTLVGSGVPLIQMLEVTGNAIDNFYIEQSLNGAIEKVKGGTALSAALEGDPNFLPLVPDMIKIGEQSGSLEKMLEKTADYYEKEVDNEIKTISTTIEPVLMIVLGIMAFTIVAAVLVPIYGLANQTLIK